MGLTMAAATLAGSLGSGFMSGLGGLFGQSSASKNALKAARETNEMNYKIWQEQRQHNIDMYEMQNEDAIEMYERQTQDARDTWQQQFDATNAYNDPSAQMQRYKDAGLNPYLMMGQGGTAGASSASPTSATGNYDQPGMQGAQAPTMQQPSDVAFVSPLATGLQTFLQSATGVSDLISQMFVNKKTDAETNKIGADTALTWENTKTQQEINKYLPERLSLERQDLASKIRLNNMKVDTEYQVQQGLIADNALKKLDLQKQQIASKYFEVNAYIDFSTRCQYYANLVADGKLKYIEGLKKVSEIALNTAKARESDSVAGYYDSLTTGQDIQNKDAGLEYNLKWNSPVYTNEKGELFDEEGKPYGPETGFQIPRRVALERLASDQFKNEVQAVKLNLLIDRENIEKVDFQDDMAPWLKYSPEMLGDWIRGIVGGVLAPYDGFNTVTKKAVNTPPKMRPIGFRPY